MMSFMPFRKVQQHGISQPDWLCNNATPHVTLRYCSQSAAQLPLADSKACNSILCEQETLRDAALDRDNVISCRIADRLLYVRRSWCGASIRLPDGSIVISQDRPRICTSETLCKCVCVRLCSRFSHAHA